MHLDTFRNYLTFEKRYSAHTVEAYVSDVEQFVHYLRDTYSLTQPNAMEHFHARSWIVHLIDMGLTPRSINRKLSSVRSWIGVLRRSGHLDRNPMARVTGPKTGKSLPEVIDSKKIAALFDECEFDDGYPGIRDRVLLELLYNCGLRRSELIELKDTSIDFSRGLLRVMGKGRKEREIPVSRDFLNTLRGFIEARDAAFEDSVKAGYLLTTDRGAKMYPKFVYNKVTSHLARITSSDARNPHALRHAFATHLAENGADINAVKELLGHSSLASTQVYMHTSIKRLKEAYDKAHPKA